MRRSGRSIAAIAAGAVLAGLGGAGLIAAWTQATADIVADDEAIRTAPETIPDFSAVPIDEDQALVAALPAPTPVPLEYAQLTASTVERMATPALRQTEAAIRDYEPRIQFDSRYHDTGTRYSEVSFGLNRPDRVRTRAPQPGANNSLASLRNRFTPPREVERSGRWVLFASDDQQAVGINLLRGRSGEMARVSLTTDRIATVGDMQAGVGWRRGSFQASFAFVDREISIYGKSRSEQFFAFTISIRPRTGSSNRQRDRMQPEAYAPRANPN